MELKVEAIDDDIKCVVLIGALDIDGAEKIDMQMSVVAEKGQLLIIDMSQVDYLASFGIRTLISAAQAVQKNGGQMVIASPQDMVEDILKTMVIDKIIPLYPTRRAAAAALRSSGEPEG